MGCGDFACYQRVKMSDCSYIPTWAACSVRSTYRVPSSCGFLTVSLVKVSMSLWAQALRDVQPNVICESLCLQEAYDTFAPTRWRHTIPNRCFNLIIDTSSPSRIPETANINLIDYLSSVSYNLIKCQKALNSGESQVRVHECNLSSSQYSRVNTLELFWSFDKIFWWHIWLLIPMLLI